VLAEYAASVVSVPEIFNYWLQAGRVDVGFLGAAQMDRYGNINTTVIGPYESPKVRLTGVGGAPEIAASAKEVAVILRQKPHAFVTSIGHRYGGDSRKGLGYSGAGPTVVITDLGILRPDPEMRELTMTALHPGTTVQEAPGWELEVAEVLETTDPPTEKELGILRELKARTEASRNQT
jgi:glutaconate CoA-transferase, subunit B